MNDKCEYLDNCRQRDVDMAAFNAAMVEKMSGIADDFKDIKEESRESTKAQWRAIDTLKDAIAKESSDRKVEDKSLEGKIRMAGYAKIVAFVVTISVLIVTIALR